jgi:hypothetical protein
LSCHGRYARGDIADVDTPWEFAKVIVTSDDSKVDTPSEFAKVEMPREFATVDIPRGFALFIIGSQCLLRGRG